jgi:hypothetical protein
VDYRAEQLRNAGMSASVCCFILDAMTHVALAYQAVVKTSTTVTMNRAHWLFKLILPIDGQLRSSRNPPVGQFERRGRAFAGHAPTKLAPLFDGRRAW